ncbi:hypothetical protein GQ457_01G024020 [Hibiscus cannabinus]
MCSRPPKNVVSMEECSILDRPRSPVAMELQPASKKGRNFEDPMEVSKQPEMLTAVGKSQGIDANANSGSQERIQDEDVLIRGEGDLSEIRFSDRVHDAIDVKLAKSVVIRFLRKSIDEEHPYQIMVWVRLPKLSYRYYTKRLFRYIVVTIGKVVRVDYNTSEGKRGRFARLVIIVNLGKPLGFGIIIDGKRQDIEYEGLPAICFKCGKYEHAKEVCRLQANQAAEGEVHSIRRDPDELYGPWMQVVNKRRRNMTKKTRIRIRNDLRKEGSYGYGGQGTQPMVVVQGVILHGKSTLDPAKQTVIEVGDVERTMVARSAKGWALPLFLKGGGPLRSVKKGVGLPTTQKVSLKPKKKNDQGALKSTLAASLSPLIVDLDSARSDGNGVRGEVEADGFSGGIWVLWKNSVHFDVLVVSKEYIHGRCRLAQDEGFCFVSFVYVSPNANKRAGILPFRKRRLHLLKLGLDHRLIVMNSCGTGCERGHRLFRYLTAWNTHPYFPSFLRSEWVEGIPIKDITNFLQHNRWWNLEVFGHIELRKNRLIARLKGIEKALESVYRPSLVRLELKFKQELEEVLDHEESLWYQKSRSEWIQLGDRNTRFFHLSTMACHSSNTIKMLRLYDGTLCDDPNVLKWHAIEFFGTYFLVVFHNRGCEICQLTSISSVMSKFDHFLGMFRWRRCVQWPSP